MESRKIPNRKIDTRLDKSFEDWLSNVAEEDFYLRLLDVLNLERISEENKSFLGLEVKFERKLEKKNGVENYIFEPSVYYKEDKLNIQFTQNEIFILWMLIKKQGGYLDLNKAIEAKILVGLTRKNYDTENYGKNLISVYLTRIRRKIARSGVKVDFEIATANNFGVRLEKKGGHKT